MEEPTNIPRKRRSRFARRLRRSMRVLRAYLLEVPARTLILIGGTIAAVLIVVILLIWLLPKKTAVSEASPSPSIELSEPTETPEPTDTPEPTQDPDPFANGLKLYEGDTNDVVPIIQQRLIDLGYLDIEETTNIYGPATKKAVRMFQFKNAIQSDGIMGKETYALLMSDEAKYFFLSRGDEGDEVTKLQNRLIALGYFAGPATGSFGLSTSNAVVEFQKLHGLDADGRAGRLTLALLYSDDALPAGSVTNTPAPATATPAASTTPASSATP